MGIGLPGDGPVTAHALEMFLEPGDQAVGAVFGVETDVELRLGTRRNDVRRLVADIDCRHMRR